MKEAYRVPRTDWMCLFPDDGSGIAIERLGLIDDRKFDEFKGPRVLVPDVGFMRLDGSRGFTYSVNDLGLAFIDSSLVVDKAESLDIRGLFNIRVEIQATNYKLIGKILDCYLKLANGTILTSQLTVDMDDSDVDMDDSDPEVKDYYLTTDWKMDGDDRRFRFFAAADQSTLSRLRFQLIPILTKKRPF